MDDADQHGYARLLREILTPNELTMLQTSHGDIRYAMDAFDRLIDYLEHKDADAPQHTH